MIKSGYETGNEQTKEWEYCELQGGGRDDSRKRLRYAACNISRDL